MPNGQGETAADYAWDAARRAQDTARANAAEISSLEKRVAKLERILVAKGIMTQWDLDA